MLFFINLFEKTELLKETPEQNEIFTKELLLEHLSQLLSLKAAIELNFLQVIRVFRNKPLQEWPFSPTMNSFKFQ